MDPRFLLDTHIVVRWLSDLKRLSREQRRVLDDAVRHGVHVGVSAMSLVELASPAEEHRQPLIGVNELLDQLDTNPAVRIIPLTTDIAREVTTLGICLPDWFDCVIVATARVLRVPLLTSDQRIIESNLVPVIE